MSSTPATGTTTPGRRAVVGINFGNAYASIALVNKEGHADCIANEDGERQIACAISFNGQEVYTGNQAKPQLVKNAKNTIVGFRNLLGKKFADIEKPVSGVSAPVVDLDGEPGYTVDILLPPPAASAKPSAANSARSTPAPTRPSSPPAPIPSTKSLTVSQVTTLFLESLKKSAEDFLGTPVEGAVLSVPESWDQTQLDALRKAAEAAGLNVLQLAAEEGLAVLASESIGSLESTPETAQALHDRTTLVLDLGSSSLTLNLLSIKQSLIHPLATLHVSSSIGGDAIDDALITHFGKEFTKKTKIPFTIPATTPEDARAEAKLRLAVEHTKRTLSASAGAASCSVESLKDGMDYSGTINRLRFDGLLASLYARIISRVTEVLKSGNVPKEAVDEVLLVGGSAGLSGLADQLEVYFGESSRVAIRTDLNTSELIAKGAVDQGILLLSIPKDDPLHAAFEHANEVIKVVATTKPIGLVFAGAKSEAEPKVVVLIPSETPIPVRRVVRIPVASGVTRVGFEVVEGEESLKDLPLPPKEPLSDDEEDEDEEPEQPEREVVIKKGAILGGVALDIVKGASVIEVQIDVSKEGGVSVKAKQEGNGEWTGFEVGK